LLERPDARLGIVVRLHAQMVPHKIARVSQSVA
jgi:hypothetical protein